MLLILQGIGRVVVRNMWRDGLKFKIIPLCKLMVTKQIILLLYFRIFPMKEDLLPMLVLRMLVL